ncbi:hypothetical protein MXE38_09420 [Anaerobiospirillum sp. NML120448]|uniref:hypothetical protein n=1 Tax=Anaerobiospirillum sp. NML120448 TaxID=2932816 RepID=UPI001FF57174|nr:hypothetical protein [Anaerobiospirillum sp. NML120448]MCK0515057.1 hypothetical protein [Anaerobiospirillum sp. NML120448]
MGFFSNLSKLFSQGNIASEIKALEAIPSSQRSSQEDVRLAFAYLRQAERCQTLKDRKEQIKQALNLYLKHEEQLQNDVNWLFHVGVCYFLLEQELRSLPYFHKVLASCSDGQVNQSFLQDAHAFIEDATNQASAFLYAGTFLEHTKKAWSDFAKVEGKLRELLQDSTSSDLYDEAQTIFYTIFNPVIKNIEGTIYQNNGRYFIEFDNDLSVLKLFELNFIESCMPEELKQNWQLNLGRAPASAPAWDPNSLIMMFDGEEIAAHELYCYLVEVNNGQFELNIFAEKLLPILNIDPQKVEGIISYAVSLQLGQMLTLRAIANIKVSKEPLNEPLSCRLDELFTYLMGKLSSNDLSFNEVLSTQLISYSFNADVDIIHNPRQGTVYGQTYLEELLSCYLENEDGKLYDLTDNGAVAVFLYFPIPQDQDQDQDQTNTESLLLSLTKEIEQEHSHYYMTLIGQAHDLKYGYLDFIAWDLTLALSIWRRVFKRRGLTTVYYQVYSAYSKSVDLITGELVQD